VTLEEITSELLSRAVELYLAVAYADGEPSEAVRGRAEWPEGLRGADLLGDERFERVPPDAPVHEAERINLRLGNARYPHMKLGIDRVSHSAQYVLVVDTHDKHFAAMVQDSERSQYRDLLNYNARVQQHIERAWTEAGLPTFERYLRSRLTDLSGRRAPEEGR